jgi:tetratricopeptide (TPR) repeat protein
VSIDNIFLTLLGYISAGFIIGDHAGHGTRAPIKVLRNVNYTRMIKPVVVLIFGVFSYYSISYVQFDRNANKFLSLNNATVLNNIYNSKIQDPKTLTDILVKVGKDNQFEIAAKFSESLLKLYPYSHQAYYAQSVYSESIKDIPQAVKYMRMAHDADKWNPTYLLGLSIYELNTGNYNLARAYLERVISIDPDQQGVKIVQERLTQLSP